MYSNHLNTTMKNIFLLLFTFGFARFAFAQEPRTLEECEQLFLKNNLQLLAEHYNIEASKASVIQARIWEQPYLSGELNAYNPEQKKTFDAGAQGQKVAAVQQLIYLGGKKKNEIAFAKSNVALAELQFQQLLIDLKYQLRQSFYTLYFDRQKINNLNQQVINVDSLANAYSVQADKNNVSLKDVVRLQALSLTFKSDLLEIQKSINEEQANLHLITGIETEIIPKVETGYFDRLFEEKIVQNTEDLLHTAMEKSPDYLYALKIIENNELMVKWQKSLAVPDLTMGAAYDQRGGAFNNQVNLTLGIPLPLWNKNKGNIKMARAQLDQTKMQKDYKTLELKNKIQTAYNNWKQQQSQFQKLQGSGQDNFKIVYNGILQNFHKRNISLLEFTDFMESYNQSVLTLSELQKQLALTCETLNYLVNEKLF